MKNFGVITACDDTPSFGRTLLALVSSCAESSIPIVVIDHGLSRQKKALLGSAGATVVRMDIPEMAAISALASKPPRNKIPINTWAKPFICESQEFFKKSIWIDADAVPIRPLHGMKRCLDHGDGFTTMNWIHGANAERANHLYMRAYQLVFGEWAHDMNSFAEATNVNAGVLGWVAGKSRFVGQWADTCRSILANEEAVLSSLCRDQTGLAILRAAKPDLFPINGPKEWNYPANGVSPGDKATRKKYHGRRLNMKAIRNDHPGVVIVHWLGPHKP
jgi:hypothetical protein